MGRYGSPWSSGWGAPENHFEYVIPDTAAAIAAGNTYLPFAMKLRSGLRGAYVGIYRNGTWQRNVYVGPAGVYNGIVDIPWGSSSLSILPLRIGHLADPSYHDEKVARVYETTENARLTLQFTYTPKIVVPPLTDGGFTQNWALTGAIQGFNTAYVDGQTSWGRLGLTITNDGTTCTVTLDMNGRTVASGSFVYIGAPFTVTLTAQNGSGLSGTVDINNIAAVVAAGIVDVRWPRSMQIYRDTFNPPTTLRDAVIFKGLNTVRWPEPADLPAGTYYYATKPLSDTATLGSLSAVVSKSPIVPPAPPTLLAYSSGNAGNLVLSFKNSLTALATYRLYMATIINGVASLNDIQATAAAGVPGAANTIAAPAITGFPGFAYPVVRAVLAGVEERNLNMLKLEFLGDGSFVPARPNAPYIASVSFSGRTITIKGGYNTEHEVGVATTLQLYVRTPAGAYAFAASGALSAVGNKGLKQASITYLFPADGYYYVELFAATAGAVLSGSASPEHLVLPSSDVMPAATGLTVDLSRS